MNFLRTSILLFIFSALSLICLSQELSTGIFSGMNFSDIHGQPTGGKWSPQSGPVQGIQIGYRLNKTLGFESGINISTIYYSQKRYPTPGIYYQYDLSSSTPYYPYPPYPYPYPYSTDINMDFRFLRIPVLVDITIPSTLSFTMKAGFYFSYLQKSNLNSNYYFTSETRAIKHEIGYIFSSGFAYPISSKFRAELNVSYLTGAKHILENSLYRHGTSEVTMGIVYSGFLKNKKPETKVNNDSLSTKVIVSLTGGIDYSWNKANEKIGDYSGYAGPSLGFSLSFPLGKGAFFQTGFTFERKGYSMKDSSTIFYRMVQDNREMYYVDTKIQTDYAVIPALLRFAVGRGQKLFISTGPWLGLKLNARTAGVAISENRSSVSYQLLRTDVYDDLERLIKKYDAGWIFGCGVSIPLPSKFQADLSLQYSAGFSDVFSQKYSTDLLKAGDKGLIIKNRTVSFVLGLRIPTDL